MDNVGSRSGDRAGLGAVHLQQLGMHLRYVFV